MGLPSVPAYEICAGRWCIYKTRDKFNQWVTVTSQHSLLDTLLVDIIAP